MSEDVTNKQSVLAESQKIMLAAAGYQESQMTEKLYWEIADKIYKRIDNDLNSIHNELSTHEGKQAVADLAVEMFKHKTGPVDQDHPLDIEKFKFKKNNKTYIISGHLQIPRAYTTTDNFVLEGSSLRQQEKEIPQHDSFMQFIVDEIEGEKLTPDSKMDIPTIITFDSNAHGLHIKGTEASLDNLNSWGEPEVISYINELKNTLQAKRE